jgi:hypothetical protein
MAFNPTANIVARHANVKDKEFGVEYFRRFAVVLIALDNESARRHVNRMCLAANTKLVEVRPEEHWRFRFDEKGDLPTLLCIGGDLGIPGAGLPYTKGRHGVLRV